MSINKLTFTFGAAVALVILVDLATGQGPPIYTNYLAAQQNYQPPEPPIQLQPVGYVHRAEYNPKKMDKEYEKALELGKVSSESGAKHQKLSKKHSDKSEYEKIEKNGPNDEFDYDGKSTPAPGVFSSLSNSMSGAWNRISSLGRSKRSVDGTKDAATTSATAPPNATVIQAISLGDDSSQSADSGKSQSRGMDSYELLQQKSNGYIYFKVPKHLVCNY